MCLAIYIMRRVEEYLGRTLALHIRRFGRTFAVLFSRQANLVGICRLKKVWMKIACFEAIGRKRDRVLSGGNNTQGIGRPNSNIQPSGSLG